MSSWLYRIWSVIISFMLLAFSSTFSCIGQSSDSQTPCFSVTAINMNVFYRGVDNPISISIPEMPDYVTLQPSVTNGSIVTASEAGHNVFNVRVSNGSSTTLYVDVNIDGVVKRVGQSIYRVKDVPPPIATIAGVEGGLVSANRLAAAPTVIPKMKNFDFELFYKVTKFDLVYQVGTDLITKPVTGSSIPGDAIAQIIRLKKGSRVYIENIEAVMLDRNNQINQLIAPVKLSPVSLKIN